MPKHQNQNISMFYDIRKHAYLPISRRADAKARQELLRSLTQLAQGRCRSAFLV